ncbi:MAG: hypothetical protein QOH08_500 [Chloroflexota bacterium]|nr:hypothetical protein [Chloroflexota bacterium]
MRVRRDIAVAAIAALVVGLSVTPRVLGAVGALPHDLVLFGWSDVLATWNDSRLPGHKIPYLDVPFAYPPLVGYVAGAISLLSGGFLAYALLWGVVIAAAAGAGAYLFARQAGHRRTLVYWACAPQLLLLSGINFDVLAAVLLGAAAIAARRRHDLRAGALLALGTAAKLFPAVSAPVHVWRIAASGDRRRAAAAAVAFAAVLAVLYLPAVLAPFSAARFIGAYAVGVTANIDSPWVIVEGLLNAAGLDGHVAVLAVTYAGFGLSYLLLVLPRTRAVSDPAVGFGLATVTLLLWTRLYSPQYSLWVLPFFVLLPLRVKSFVLLAIADIGVFFTIYPLTLVLDRSDPLQGVLLPLLFASVALRVVALIVIWRDIAGSAKRTTIATATVPVGGLRGLM